MGSEEPENPVPMETDNTVAAAVMAEEAALAAEDVATTEAMAAAAAAAVSKRAWRDLLPTSCVELEFRIWNSLTLE